jgi:hypothetical protein
LRYRQRLRYQAPTALRHRRNPTIDSESQSIPAHEEVSLLDDAAAAANPRLRISMRCQRARTVFYLAMQRRLKWRGWGGEAVLLWRLMAGKT